MARTLDVYLHRDLVGRLTQDKHGETSFVYAPSWLENEAAAPLSRSLPLRTQRFTRKECRGFFAGLLPEEVQRETIAHNLGVSARNDFALLEKIGGECAGAVTFVPEGGILPTREAFYRELPEAELAVLLKELPRHPLLAGERDVRLSLAGAQDKVAVLTASDKIAVPLGGAPSSAILKPASVLFPDLVFNEAFCMRLAGLVGLPVANVQVGRAGETDYLLIERYDRRVQSEDGTSWPHVERLHQEDFCQALGLPPETKYQSEGGPSLKQCFDLLRAASDTPVIDLPALLDAVIFNFLIGNHDAHGKNFSLLYDGPPSSRTTRLAPFYDLLSTVHYPGLTQKMAMKIGGEYESAKVAPRHFERFAEEAGLAKPLVRKRVMDLAQAVVRQLDKTGVSNPVVQALTKLIYERCQRTRDAFTRGKA